MKQEWEEEHGTGNLRNKISHPFKAPEGYFENLNNEIHSRIESTAKERPFVMPFRLTWKVIPALAVVVLVILLFYKKNSNQEEYIALNYDELYTSGLVSLDENTLTEYIEFASDTSVTEEEMYIIEGMNEEVLINEL